MRMSTRAESAPRLLLRMRFRLSVVLSTLLCAAAFASPALAEDVFLPKENTPVRLKGFPGYTLTRKGQEIIVTRSGKKYRTLESSAAGAGTAGKPDVLVYDLDFDGVPELFLLQIASEKDSVYSLTHFKHGVGQKNYLFSHWPDTFFADPIFDPKTRTLTARTSAGYATVYVRPLRPKPDEAEYSLARKTFPDEPLSPKEQERAAFFADGGRLPRYIHPLLPVELPRSFMPGALPIDSLPMARRKKSWQSGPLPRGTAVAASDLTPDGRWIHVWAGDDTKQGWVPVESLFVQTTESVSLRETPDGPAVPETGDCPGALAAGAQLLLLHVQKTVPGEIWMEARTACGRTGWVPFKQLRLPE